MIASVTGHRPKHLSVEGLDFKSGVPIWDHIAWWFEQQFERVDGVITGGALGVDICAARTAIKNGVPHELAIPYEGYVEGFSSKHRRRLEWVMENSHKVTTVSEGPYGVWKLHKRNEYMVDNSDLLLGVWNGKPSGGTAACIKYARKVGKPFTILTPEYTTRLVKDG